MRLALIAMRALEPPRDQKQRRFHIPMMPVSEFTRFWRDVVSARIAAQPKAIAEALYVGKVNLAPGIALWLCVPHHAHSGSFE